MPYKITLKIILFFLLPLTGSNLKGQALNDENSRGDKVDTASHTSWYFPYESHEKALAADPAASVRYISLEDGWKFFTGEQARSGNFYDPGFSDSSWETLTGNDTLRLRQDAAPGIILFRKKINLDESQAKKQLFISPALLADSRIWVNGKEVGHTSRGSGRREFNISSFVQPGENLLALKSTLKPAAADSSAEIALQGIVLNSEGSGMMLYERPQTHFSDILINGSLDKAMQKGLLRLDLGIVNRMDSVRERFWGVLREPIYSAISIEAVLVDDKGDIVVDFNKENNIRIQGGNRLDLHFEESIPDIRPWSHETPYCYRLNITLLDGSGRVLEAVSQQVGFSAVEVSGGRLLVNGTAVPLRVFQPEADRPRPLNGEQLLEDIRQIKQGNFNAVYASSYLAYPAWYGLSNQHGVYILDTRLERNPNNPSVVPLKEPVPVPAKPVVELELADFLKGTIRLRNHFAFRDLSAYYLQWELLRNGEKAEEGTIQNLGAAPGEETMIALGYKTGFYEGSDYFLNLRLRTKTADSLVPADLIVASRQFRLSPYQYSEEYQVDKGLIDLSDGPGSIALNGYDFRIVFDKRSGQISRYSYKGKELVTGGPELNFRRLPASADSLKEAHKLWNSAAEKAQLIDYQVTEDVNGNYYLSFTKVLLGGDARLFQKFRVDGRGSILVENVFVRMQGEDYPLMPGFGTSFRLPADYRRMEWYGREPGLDNEVGIYAGTVDAYTGNDKSDVRWVRLTRGDGYGLLIRKEKDLLNLTAVREGPEDSPLWLSVDLTQEPIPFKSLNFTYRIIPYISSANVQ